MPHSIESASVPPKPRTPPTTTGARSTPIGMLVLRRVTVKQVRPIREPLAQPAALVDTVRSLPFDARTEAPTLVLVVRSGVQAGCVLHIGNRNLYTIGRSSDADLGLTDVGVSRSHAMIARLGDGTLELIDCQSTNGTFLDERPIRVARLQAGATIRLGHDMFITVHASEPQRDQPAPR